MLLMASTSATNGPAALTMKRASTRRFWPALVESRRRNRWQALRSRSRRGGSGYRRRGRAHREGRRASAAHRPSCSRNSAEHGARSSSRRSRGSCDDLVVIEPCRLAAGRRRWTKHRKGQGPALKRKRLALAASDRRQERSGTAATRCGAVLSNCARSTRDSRTRPKARAARDSASRHGSAWRRRRRWRRHSRPSRRASLSARGPPHRARRPHRECRRQ